MFRQSSKHFTNLLLVLKSQGSHLCRLPAVTWFANKPYVTLFCVSKLPWLASFRSHSSSRSPLTCLTDLENPIRVYNPKVKSFFAVLRSSCSLSFYLLVTLDPLHNSWSLTLTCWSTSPFFNNWNSAVTPAIALSMTTCARSGT